MIEGRRRCARRRPLTRFRAARAGGREGLHACCLVHYATLVGRAEKNFEADSVHAHSLPADEHAACRPCSAAALASIADRAPRRFAAQRPHGLPPPPARRDRARRARRAPSSLCSRPPRPRWWRAAPSDRTMSRRRRVAIARDSDEQDARSPCSAVAPPLRTRCGGEPGAARAHTPAQRAPSSSRAAIPPRPRGPASLPCHSFLRGSASPGWARYPPPSSFFRARVLPLRAHPTSHSVPLV